jgi:hypothetical protein
VRQALTDRVSARGRRSGAAPSPTSGQSS